MGLRVLDAAAAADRADWLRRWNAWPGREVSAHPTYAELFARPVDRVLCAAAEIADGGVLYPFVLRPLSAEPWTERECWDLTTPYGYGGPFAWGSAVGQAEVFWRQLVEWLAATRVVTSFARLSLFPEQLLPFPGEVLERMPNVVRSLDLSEDEMWRDYAHKVRKNVNRARKRGLSVEIDRTGERLDDFLRIYISTMERRDAADAYRFSPAFFERIVSDLAGSFAFFHARDEAGRVVSTELVLVSAEHIYSFLGGTLEGAFADRPNDLLKHEIVSWGRAEGKRAFVLGGGYGGEDGIYRYKLGFAPSGQVPFQVGRWVHDPELTRALELDRQRWESSHGRDWKPDERYFPPYRG